MAQYGVTPKLQYRIEIARLDLDPGFLAGADLEGLGEWLKQDFIRAANDALGREQNDAKKEGI